MILGDFEGERRHVDGWIITCSCCVSQRPRLRLRVARALDDLEAIDVMVFGRNT